VDVVTYSLMCYGITAVISFGVIAIIVGINNFMSRYGSKGDSGEV